MKSRKKKQIFFFLKNEKQKPSPIITTFYLFAFIENLVGGAMYISSGDDGVAVEAELGYVPNNPLFGLPFDSPQVKRKK